MAYIVYILRTEKNTLYTGQTKNLENRMRQHKAGKGSKYVRAHGNFELVYTEELATITEALKRELEIKKLSKQQKEIIISTNSSK